MNTDFVKLESLLLPVLGAAGGLASFLLALKQNKYKNNRYLRKSGIEVVGGAVTAACLVYAFRGNTLVPVFAFLVGTAWSQILQRLRSKITRLVEAALGDLSQRDDE
jgi:hypothetical protein